MNKVFITYLMLDDMNNGNSGISGTAIIAICSIVGTIIGGAIITLGTWYGTEKNNSVQQLADEQMIDTLKGTIGDMKSTITELDEENKRKQDSIEKMASDLLIFSSTIDTNTKLTKGLVKKTQDLTSSTMHIAKQINSEQQQRGTLDFTVEVAERYNFGIGSNLFSVDRSSLEQGYQFAGMGFALPVILRLEGNKLYVTVKILDGQGDLIADIRDNEWNLNKNSVFSLNFDDTGLEVIDKKGFINLQIDIIDSNFSIKMFFHSGNSVLFVNDLGVNSLKLNKENYQRYIELALSVKPVFRHFGENYINKRLN